jgi:hypothetical protein
MHSISVSLAFVAIALSVATIAPDRDSNSSQEQPVDALVQHRLEILIARAAAFRERLGQPGDTYEDLYNAEKQLLNARLDLAIREDRQIAILESIVDLAKHREERIVAIVKLGVRPETDFMAAKIERLDAEIALARSRRK